MELQGISVRRTVRAAGTRIRLLPRVYSYVVIQRVLSAGTVGAVRAKKGLFSRMRAYVFGHVVFPIGGIVTEGTLVELAGDSPSAKPRPITVQFHLLGTPSLVIVIISSSSHIILSHQGELKQWHTRTQGTSHTTSQVHQALTEHTLSCFLGGDNDR